MNISFKAAKINSRPKASQPWGLGFNFKFLFLLLHTTTLLFVAPHAWAQLDIVNNAVAHANGTILANPPLPMLDNKKGAQKFSVQAGVFEVDKPPGNDIKSLQYGGYAISLLYNSLFTDSIGYYLLGNYTHVDGDITAPGANSSGQIQSTNINSQIFMLSGGVTLSLLKTDLLRIPLFFGPALIQGNYNASFLHTASNSSVLDDFDARVQPSLLGYVAGVQFGLYFSKHFALVPYYVLARPFSEDDTCQEFTTTEVRVSGGLFDQSSAECMNQDPGQKSLVGFNVFVESFGLNLLFPTIGLGVNVFSESGDVPLFEGTPITTFFISYSIGTL